MNLYLIDVEGANPGSNVQANHATDAVLNGAYAELYGKARHTVVTPPPVHNGPAYWFKVSAKDDGSFSVTNTRNSFTKTYARR